MSLPYLELYFLQPVLRPLFVLDHRLLGHTPSFLFPLSPFSLSRTSWKQGHRARANQHEDSKPEAEFGMTGKLKAVCNEEGQCHAGK